MSTHAGTGSKEKRDKLEVSVSVLMLQKQFKRQLLNTSHQIKRDKEGFATCVCVYYSNSFLNIFLTIGSLMRDRFLVSKLTPKSALLAA